MSTYTAQDPMKEDFCPDCECCGTEWMDCYQCDGQGLDGHDCGEDCCCCLDPEENVRCQACGGHGGWLECGGRCEGGKHDAKPDPTPEGT